VGTYFVGTRNSLDQQELLLTGKKGISAYREPPEDAFLEMI
jgi:hypothetical protein